MHNGFKDFILTKDFNGFLLDLIERDHFVPTKYSVSNFVVTLFGNRTKFREILESQSVSKWSYLNEFKLFFDKYEASEGTEHIYFEFKTIPVESKFSK